MKSAKSYKKQICLYFKRCALFFLLTTSILGTSAARADWDLGICPIQTPGINCTIDYVISSGTTKITFYYIGLNGFESLAPKISYCSQGPCFETLKGGGGIPPVTPWGYVVEGNNLQIISIDSTWF